MKAVWFFVLLVFSVEVMAQETAKLKLPKPEEVERIEISAGSAVNWYSPETLLKLLPKFVAAEGTYLTKQPFQRGKFILKNGRQIDWLANSADSILLSEGSTEQLFMLPKEKPAQEKKQPLFRIWDARGKEGFIDAEGRLVSKPQNDAVGDFSEGLAPVKIGDKWGYINEKNEVVIKPRWKDNEGYLPAVSAFHEGLAAVIESASWGVRDDSNYWTYKCGYIDKKGEYVIKPKLRQSCGAFSEGLARIEVDLGGDEYEEGKGWIGFMDAKGNWAIKPRFFEAGDFSGGFALVQDDPLPKDLYIKIPGTDLVRDNLNRKSLYLVDKTGRSVANQKDCLWRYSFREGLALAFAEDNRAGFINEACEQVFRLDPDIKTDAIYFIAKGYDGTGRYGSSTYFSDGLAMVYKEIEGQKVFGYLDRAGRAAIPFQFADATPFSDGLAGVVVREKDKQYNAYINRQGKILLKNTRGIAPFYNGLAFYHLFTWTISESPGERNIYGYMNKQGKFVWLSPGAENYLDKNWIRENYVGAKK